MKKLFALTVVAGLTAASAGCHQKNFLQRCCNPCAPRCEAQYTPQCEPCDPCEGRVMQGAPYADPQMSGGYFEEGGPMIQQGGPIGPGPGPGPIEMVQPGPGPL